MSLYTDLRQKILHGHDPYAGFPKGWEGTWYGDGGACRPIFRRALEMSKAKLVVEVGSFVGESTIHMAKVLKEISPGAVIICVDTWLGGIDHWLKVPEKLRFWFGRPSLYYQFIGNVIQHECQDVILPLALDSINAARLLTALDIHPDMVYVDASHEHGDVLRDYEAYWDLLKSGGCMLVDDLTNWFPGVLQDFEYFCAISYPNRKPEIEGEKGLFIKP